MLLLKNSLLVNFEFEDLKNQCNQSLFPNVFKLVQVGIPIQISSSTYERIFSVMRNSVGEEKFTMLSTFRIKSDLTKKIDGEVIF